MRLPRLLPVVSMLVLSACGGDDTGTDNGDGALVSVSVSPTGALALSAGVRQSITATGVDGNGRNVAGTTFTFSSGSPAIAYVSSTGAVIGLSAGTSTITVTGTANGVIRTTNVQVTVNGALSNTASVVAGASTNDFTPNLVAINRGGNVAWTFPGIQHNVTFAAAAGAPTNVGNTGGSTTPVARTFATAGVFNYDCTLHAGMIGTVVVP